MRSLLGLAGSLRGCSFSRNCARWQGVPIRFGLTGLKACDQGLIFRPQVAGQPIAKQRVMVGDEACFLSPDSRIDREKDIESPVSQRQA